MKYRICISALLLWAGMQVSASNNQKEVVIKIIETSDVHGNFFPYNFIERKEWSGSLARVHSFVPSRARNQLVLLAACCGIQDRKSTRLNSSHSAKSRMPSSA